MKFIICIDIFVAMFLMWSSFTHFHFAYWRGNKSYENVITL